jgi:PST family polysaccharide transporter
MVLNRINRDSDRVTIGKNFMSLTILQIANVLLPLITLPFLVRILGTEKFGLVILAQSIAVFFNLIVEFGFNISATREVAVNRSNRNRLGEIFSGVLAIKGILLVIAFFVLSLIVFLIPKLEQDWCVFLLSFGVVIGHALFPQWFFQGIQKMSVITIVHVLAKSIFTLLVLIFIRKEQDYLLVPMFSSIGYIVSGALGFIWSLRMVTPVTPSIQMIRLYFSDSYQLFISNLVTSIYSYGNVIILGALTNNSVVGVYGAMEKLILAVKSMYSPFLQALFPYAASKSNPQIRVQVRKLSGPLSLLGFLVSLVLFIFADPILELIYDNSLITESGNVLRILSFIALFSALNMLLNYLYLSAVKKYQERMQIMISAGLFNVICGLILVGLYGIYGMAFTAILTEVLLLLLGAFYFYKIKNE